MVFGIIPSAISAVTTAVSSIGSALKATISTIGPIIAGGLDLLRKAAPIIEAIGRVLDIIKPEEKVVELGDRALQAREDGITPDKFDTYDEYLAEIRSINLDPEKTKKYSEEARIATGIAVSAKALDEKYKLSDGMGGMLCTLAIADRGYFTDDRLLRMVKMPADLGKITSYFSGKLDTSENREVGQILTAQEKALHPEKSEKTIKQEFLKAGDAVEKMLANPKQN